MFTTYRSSSRVRKNTHRSLRGIDIANVCTLHFFERATPSENRVCRHLIARRNTFCTTQANIFRHREFFSVAWQSTI